jgi:hypothetical protein
MLFGLPLKQRPLHGLPFKQIVCQARCECKKKVAA